MPRDGHVDSGPDVGANRASRSVGVGVGALQGE
jgi:hypothetical protein